MFINEIKMIELHGKEGNHRKTRQYQHTHQHISEIDTYIHFSIAQACYMFVSCKNILTKTFWTHNNQSQLK